MIMSKKELHKLLDSKSDYNASRLVPPVKTKICSVYSVRKIGNIISERWLENDNHFRKRIMGGK